MYNIVDAQFAKIERTLAIALRSFNLCLQIKCSLCHVFNVFIFQYHENIVMLRLYNEEEIM